MEFADLHEKIRDRFSPGEMEFLEHAWVLTQAAHAGQRRVSGEPYTEHCLQVASLLADWGLDMPTLVAGLLHDVVEDSTVSVEDLKMDFSDEIASMVDGVTKLSQFDDLSGRGDKNLLDNEAESLRKMILAGIDEVRVVIIKLADRLHNMRTLGSLPEDRRQRNARETLEIFAPLANRLGMWQIKWELEDLGFRWLEPERYKEIARLIGQRQEIREQHIKRIVQTLKQRLKSAGIKAVVSGRPKHIYSIHRKMLRKNLPFEQIYDIRGVRIIVDTSDECYTVLGLVHNLWRPIPGEFDDFIAMPKDNMYRSLHTSVVADDGNSLDVQIRTHEMHRTAELGIAAHWRYKEGRKENGFDAKIAWLRSLMDWRQEVDDAREFVQSLKEDVFEDRVLVFTPKGDIKDLPAGATPIDFAYHIHTEVGHRCRGAKVNGRLRALDHCLQNGDQVEIITTKRGGPSRDWLNPNLGYIKSARARQKIRQWFRRQSRQENILRGREILEKELRRLGISQMSYEEVAARFDYEKTDDFLAAVGYGDVHTQQLATRALQIHKESKKEEESLKLPTTTPRFVPTDGVTVQGVGDLLTKTAGCCNPLPGDDIQGYVTRGQGVTIHRRDCKNLLYLTERDSDRLIEVTWGPEKQTYPVVVIIRAYDRGGLLRDITSLVADENCNLSAVNITTHKKEHMTTITVTMEISSVAQLSRILTRIERLPNVVQAQRQTA
ncbi:MAG: (p)ppGpp synthetase [Anaerolineaceae bacterium 4572_32.1]|nr:MAG: (p)ppGpp synthetase [Anaerolineaceae bacterium 4572_32.1]